jgi:hypothetical protein
MGFARRTAWDIAEETESLPAPAAEGTDEVSIMTPPPPLPPSVQRRPGGTGRDDESLRVVFEMAKAAIDLQFSIAERVDSKIRAYFGFAATVYGVAQALVLNSGVHEKLGSYASALEYLAIVATLLLVGTMVATLHALRPHDEQEVSDAKLRDLLNRGFRGDERVGAEGINLMIGQLNRRQCTNNVRHDRLKVVIVMTGVTALVAFVQVALAVEALT